MPEASSPLRTPFGLALLVLLPMVAIATLVATPHYETNDDAWLMLYQSGRVAATEPAGEVFFLNLHLSRLVAGLYRLAPAVPWYGAMLAGTVALSILAIGFAVLRLGSSKLRLALLVALAVCLGLPALIELHFSRVAFLSGLAGALLLWSTWWRRPVSRLALVCGSAAATAALLASFLIRWQASCLAMAVAAPLLVHLLLRSPDSRRPLLAICSGLAVLLLGLQLSHHRFYHRDPEWRRVVELNRLAARIIDYQQIRYDRCSRELFEAIGWSRNDFRMMRSWFYADPEVFSVEKLSRMSAGLPEAGARRWRQIAPAARSVARRVTTSPVAWLTAILILGTALLLETSPASRWVLAAGISVAAALAVYLQAFMKLPPHVFEPLVSSSAWLALVLGGAPSPARGRRLGGIAALALLVPLQLFARGSPLLSAVRGGRLAEAANRELRSSLSELDELAPGTIVSWGFPVEIILPLERKTYLDELRVVAVGGLNQSPVQRRMMESQGIRDVYRALYTRDDVLLAVESPELGEHLVQYIAEHYDATVTLEPAFQRGALALWRLTHAPPEPLVPSTLR